MSTILKLLSTLLLLSIMFSAYGKQASQLDTPVKASTDDELRVINKQRSKSSCEQYCNANKVDKSYTEQVHSRQNNASSVGYERVKSDALAPRNKWSDFLPIWGVEAREKGYLLPLPFGVSIVGLTQKQPFTVSKIGLSFDGQESDKINGFIGDSITAKNLKVSDTTYNLRFDTWIFPFWNIYGIAGETRGKATLELDVNLGLPTLLLVAGNIGNGLNEKRCASVNLPYEGPAPGHCLVAKSGIATTLNFHGSVLGYGTTIAGGYGDFFGMFDVNYSEADINIAIEKTQQTVYSARIGWNGTMGGYQGQLWVGAMKQDIEQQIAISTPGGKVAVLVDQHTSSPTNYLIGGQWNITEEWSVIAETNFAFSDRQQFMMQLGYRF